MTLPLICGGRLSPFSLTLRICGSLWQSATYKAAKARQGEMEFRLLAGADVSDAIQLLTDLTKRASPNDGCAFCSWQHLCKRASCREAADEYHEVVRRDPGDMVALAAQVKALIDTSAYNRGARAVARLRAKRNQTMPQGTSCSAPCISNSAITSKAEPELELGPWMP